MNQFDNVLPIWGIQKLEELDEFLSYDENTVLDNELREAIEKDKKELVDFDRFLKNNCSARRGVADGDAIPD